MTSCYKHRKKESYPLLVINWQLFGYCYNRRILLVLKNFSHCMIYTLFCNFTDIEGPHIYFSCYNMLPFISLLEIKLSIFYILYTSFIFYLILLITGHSHRSWDFKDKLAGWPPIQILINPTKMVTFPLNWFRLLMMSI